MAVLPEEIPTGTLKGQFYFVNEDSIDPDTNPELTVVQGFVRCIASVKSLRMASKKAIVIPLRFDAKFDGQGNLVPANGTGVGMEMPAVDSPLFDTTDWYYTAHFELVEVETGFTVNLPPVDFQIFEGQVTDLADVIPVAPSPGVITTRGIQGIQGAPGVDGSNVIPTAEAVAYEIGTPGTLAHTELSATIGGSIDVSPVIAGKVNETKVGFDDFATKNARAFRTWHSQLAYRHARLARILVLGDSNGEGMGAIGYSNKWVTRLADLMLTRFPTAGVSAYGIYRPPFYASSTIGSAAVLTGGLIQNVYGLGARSFRMAASGDAVQWAFNMTSAKIPYQQGPTLGKFNIIVDGGAPVLVDCANAVTKDAALTQAATGLTAGSHTIRCEWVSGVVNIGGIWGFNGDENKGIQVLDSSHSGATSGYYLESGRGNGDYLTNAAGAYTPDLVMIALGVNDWITGVSPATYKANLQTIIAKYKAGVNPDPSFLLVICHERSAPGGAVAPWADYVNAAWEVAAADPDVTAVDMGKRLAPVVGDPTSSYYDEVHLNNRGHSVQADALAGFISPR